MKTIYFILILAVFSSCKSKQVNTAEKPLARVYDNYLYAGDLNGVIPSGLSARDSAAMTNEFIEKWIRNQLLLNKAEMNLTDQEKDVEDQIESYRSSLLIYAYQQHYLLEKLDTVVNDSEIETYYKENQPNFVLGETLMKGLFIKLPTNAPQIYKLRQWYKSENAEELKELEGYCFKYAAVYDHFNENWVNMNEVLRMIPSGGISSSGLLNRKYLETKDADFYYFLSIKEIAPEGTVSPYELVKNDIHYIILNKRKVTLVNELNASIYSDAQNREQFTIY